VTACYLWQPASPGREQWQYTNALQTARSTFIIIGLELQCTNMCPGMNKMKEKM
jgi:hypothetical protein